MVALVLAIVLALAACSTDDSGGAQPTDPVSPARGEAQDAAGRAPAPASASASATVPPAGSAGCGRPLEPGVGGTVGGDAESVEKIMSRRVERSYRLAVPTDGNNTDPRPLVLNFHGSGSNAVEQSVYTKIPEQAKARGWIVITPDAIGGNWSLASPSDTTSRDRVYATDLLDDIESRFCVDTNRVWADGLSLGAAFASDLGCALPDRIAAVGLVTVEVLFEPCPRTLPVMVFHGTEDPIVPYSAGRITADQFEGTPTPGTASNMADWAKRNQCDPQPDITKPSSEVEVSTWQNCAPGAETVLYTIVGGGHTWPGSPVKVKSLGYTTDQVDATALILDFFARHPLAPT